MVRAASSQQSGIPPRVMPDSLQSPRTISTVRDAMRVLEQLGGTVIESAATWENPIPSRLVIKQLIYNGAVVERDAITALEYRRRNWQLFRQIFAKYDFIISPTIQF